MTELEFAKELIAHERKLIVHEMQMQFIATKTHTLLVVAGAAAFLFVGYRKSFLFWNGLNAHNGHAQQLQSAIACRSKPTHSKHCALMARRGEHLPAHAATKCPLAVAGVVANLPARLAVIFSLTEVG